MHIPDGYLSPATCTALYASSAPFWYVALQRVKKTLHTRLIPLLSLFAAFSFVIMMFNLPLPGGTTGHAVGIGLATVVLGPWAAMLAVSVAIVIQALFFGDGGITAIGANCFNMAIVGALVAYAVYRLLAGRSPIQSFRRVAAAGMAGYAAINVSALFAAIEFGIQPLLYHDASGAPLYCPYPLSVAIPAMMLGHLTIAGIAELVVSAGVVSFIQKSDPSLLKATSSSAPAQRPGSAGDLVAGSLTPARTPAADSARSQRPGSAGDLVAGSLTTARSLRPGSAGDLVAGSLTTARSLRAGSAGDLVAGSLTTARSLRPGSAGDLVAGSLTPARSLRPGSAGDLVAGSLTTARSLRPGSAGDLVAGSLTTARSLRPGSAGDLVAGSLTTARSLRPGSAGDLVAGSLATARSLRPLWLGLAALMILTPLGILAAGSAWGEWAASDYSNPAVRQQIAASSFQQAAPLQAPQGLARLATVWTAPFVRYAPPYVSSAAFGYLLSAMFGAGLVMLASLAVGRFIRAQAFGDSEERAA